MFINLSLLLLLAAAAAGQMKKTQCPVTPQHFVENNPVEAEVGSDALLPCRLKPGNILTDDETLAWSKGVKEIYIIRNKKTVLDQTYKHRLSVSIEEFNKGNASLKLSGVKESDAGDYCCCIYSRKNPLELRCTNATLVLKESQRNVNKDQTTPNDTNSSTGTYAVVGCLLAALVAVIAALLVRLTRKSYKEQRRKNSNVADNQQGNPESIPLDNKGNTNNEEDCNGLQDNPGEDNNLNTEDNQENNTESTSGQHGKC